MDFFAFICRIPGKISLTTYSAIKIKGGQELLLRLVLNHTISLEDKQTQDIFFQFILKSDALYVKPKQNSWIELLIFREVRLGLSTIERQSVSFNWKVTDCSYGRNIQLGFILCYCPSSDYSNIRIGAFVIGCSVIQGLKTVNAVEKMHIELQHSQLNYKHSQKFSPHLISVDHRTNILHVRQMLDQKGNSAYHTIEVYNTNRPAM
jgi:hypothetical protein